MLVGRSAASIRVRDNKGRTPFQEASVGGHHDVAQFLLEHGAEEE
jgi:ankyrin repeat protein